MNGLLLDSGSTSFQSVVLGLLEGGSGLNAGDTFTIEAGTGSEFEAELVFFARGSRADGNVGFVPDTIGLPTSELGAVFEMSLVLEPLAAMLACLSGAALFRRRRL